MIKSKVEMKMVEKPVEVKRACICDHCGKVIFSRQTGNVRYDAADKKVHYYKITTGHNDWGNDSCDSIETIDICTECAKNVFEEYLDRSLKSIPNSEYIEIEHHWNWSEKDEPDFSDGTWVGFE